MKDTDELHDIKERALRPRVRAGLRGGERWVPGCHSGAVQATPRPERSPGGEGEDKGRSPLLESPRCRTSHSQREPAWQIGQQRKS